ncbi:hypothetical protein ABZT47_01060 [Sphaerisporangium sp. NPDC005289]|uniref:hypothetical protein n=1 Tax=Sphaerisporangium sp. NPDC005289 TaxID=3155247 RepID=UPI0033BDB386
MSEYQYYEFVAIDRPLTDDERAEVHSISPDARVTSTTFADDDTSGEFGGDPALMMERYYDAHVYVADWGAAQVMLRIPGKLLGIDAVEPYLLDERVEAWVAGEHLILDFRSEDEDADPIEAPDRLLPAMAGLRAELASGDLRPLYLAWLAAIGAWERDEDAFDEDMEDEQEPPVPPGMASLTPAQRALADFLRLDADLLATAATASPEPPSGRDDPLTAWLEGLPEQDKNALLLRAVRGDADRVRMEVLHRFREGTPLRADARQDVPRRTVAQLLDATAARRSG